MTYTHEEVQEAIKDLEKNCSGNVFYPPVTWAASQYLKEKQRREAAEEVLKHIADGSNWIEDHSQRAREFLGKK